MFYIFMVCFGFKLIFNLIYTYCKRYRNYYILCLISSPIVIYYKNSLKAIFIVTASVAIFSYTLAQFSGYIDLYFPTPNIDIDINPEDTNPENTMDNDLELEQKTISILQPMLDNIDAAQGRKYLHITTVPNIECYQFLKDINVVKGFPEVWNEFILTDNNDLNFDFNKGLINFRRNNPEILINDISVNRDQIIIILNHAEEVGVKRAYPYAYGLALGLANPEQYIYNPA